MPKIEKLLNDIRNIRVVELDVKRDLLRLEARVPNMFNENNKEEIKKTEEAIPEIDEALKKSLAMIKKLLPKEKG